MFYPKVPIQCHLEDSKGGGEITTKRNTAEYHVGSRSRLEADSAGLYTDTSLQDRNREAHG